MSDNGERRKWGAADKLRIVLAGMQPRVEVSDLCRREGLNPVLYYAWKKQLLGSAGRVFEIPKRPGLQEQRRDAEVQRLKSVIAEIPAENLDAGNPISSSAGCSPTAAARRSKSCAIRRGWRSRSSGRWS
jgi:transposase-like protein